MKTIQQILCISVLLLAMASCSNEADDKLDGKWQLQKVEANGTTIAVDTVFYNFQTSLFMYQIYTPASNTYRHCFGFKTIVDNKRLQLELTPYPVDVPRFLAYTDWKSSKVEFAIEQLNATRLVLKAVDGKSYTFRRF
jgi:hypothetical protein